MAYHAYTILPSDVGNQHITPNQGPRIWIGDIMGTIQTIDVGKRIYGPFPYHVESPEQREARAKE